MTTALHESAVESKQRQTVTAKLPTPRSQQSYKALSPKAPPLPPSLAMRRDGHGRSDAEAAPTNASPGYNSRKASRASVFKSITQDGNVSRLSTPAGSDKAAAAVKKSSKPGSTRTTPRGSKTNTPLGSKAGTPKIRQSPLTSQSPKAGQSPQTRPSPQAVPSPLAEQSPKGGQTPKVVPSPTLTPKSGQSVKSGQSPKGTSPASQRSTPK